MKELRYIDKNGKEQAVGGIKEFLEAVESGRLGPETMVFEEETTRWIKANESAEYRSLASGRPVASARDERKQLARGRLVAAGLLLAGVGAFLLTSLLEDKAASRVGYAFGQAAVWLLLGTIVIYLSTRLLSPKNGISVWIAGCALFFLYSAYQCFSIVEDVRDQKLATAAHRLADLMDQSVRPDETSRAPSSPPIAPIASRPNSATLKDGIDLAERHTRAMAAATQEFEAKLAKLNLENVLTPRSLTTDGGIAESRRVLILAKDIVSAFEKQAWVMMDEALRDAVALPLPPKEKEDFLRGMKNSRVQSVQLLKDWFDVQRSFLAEADAMVGFMSSKVGTTEVRDQQVLFADSPDADRYNAHIAKIQKLVLREQELMSQRAEQVKKISGQLRKMTQ